MRCVVMCFVVMIAVLFLAIMLNAVPGPRAPVDMTPLPVGFRYRGAVVLDRLGQRVFVTHASGRAAVIGPGTVGTLCSMSESASR